ncbi:hypothetical protein ABH946_001480 [Bacillus sp. RC145]|uniref:hypothetical protein n=1 Tax=Bacillus TaxID=1386 RepID=UPI001C016C53|nr:hypothetical protein [Bacillus mycoides]MED0887487.1 hypothetical protein [Bacillus mycoides]MED0926985.1 hypothetical protein [Bacillus mycoides]MED0941418.1 hypothetical protein [Bacillus mycoides]MED1041948.1 hypothetical protein [Bacillus mycoides]QWG41789.1 hypothetical protein EXW35_26525 [Bacillus mycoides]
MTLSDARLKNIGYKNMKDVLVKHGINQNIVDQLEKSESAKITEMTFDCKDISEILRIFAKEGNKLENLQSAYRKLQSKKDIQGILNKAKTKLNDGYNNSFAKELLDEFKYEDEDGYVYENLSLEELQEKLKELQEKTYLLLMHMQNVSNSVGTSISDGNLKKHLEACNNKFEYITIFTYKYILEKEKKTTF